MRTSNISSRRLKFIQYHLLRGNHTSLVEKLNTEDLAVKESASLVKVTLNRPKQLNSLTMTMMDGLSSIIKIANQSQNPVILLGNNKAFCSGGDLKEMLQETSDKERFLRYCYKAFGVIFRLAALNTPSLAVCDGYAFGMGCGLLTLSKIRIVTEAAMLCMPQARNGTLSQDGIAYACSGLPKYIGKFLVLTGENLKGAEICQAGLADHFVLRKNLPTLLNELENHLKNGSQLDQLKEVITKYEEKSIKKVLTDEDKLEKYFSDKYLKDIIGRLDIEAQRDAKAEYWLRKVKEGCPWMLLHNNFLMEHTSSKSLEECFNLEYHFINRIRPEDAVRGLSRLFSKSKDAPKWSMSFEEIDKFNEDELIGSELPNYDFNTLNQQ